MRLLEQERLRVDLGLLAFLVLGQHRLLGRLQHAVQLA
jgi:hypothetical protein